MRSRAEAAFFDFSERFEGYTDFMYLDSIRLVTTGVGNLIDQLPLALRLPWKKPDGSAATHAEIASAWRLVKEDKTLDPLRGGMQYKSITTLRLSRPDVESLVKKKLAEMESIIRYKIPKYDDMPASAQLAVASMSWAIGPHGFDRFPKFCAAASAMDFKTMANECNIATLPSIKKDPNGRNAWNRKLLLHSSSGTNPEELPDGVEKKKACPTCGRL